MRTVPPASRVGLQRLRTAARLTSIVAQLLLLVAAAAEYDDLWVASATLALQKPAAGAAAATDVTDVDTPWSLVAATGTPSPARPQYAGLARMAGPSAVSVLDADPGISRAPPLAVSARGRAFERRPLVAADRYPSPTTACRGTGGVAAFDRNTASGIAWNSRETDRPDAECSAPCAARGFDGSPTHT